MRVGLRAGLRGGVFSKNFLRGGVAGFLKACGRDPAGFFAGLKRLNFVDKKLVKTINAFIMYKIVSFFQMIKNFVE